LSTPAYRRVSTMILVPTTPGRSSVEMYQVDPLDLNAAQERDARAFGADPVAPPLSVEPHAPPDPVADDRSGVVTPEATGRLAAHYVKSGMVMLSSAFAAARGVLARNQARRP